MAKKVTAEDPSLALEIPKIDASAALFSTYPGFS
jgi:hypothetical protein